MNPWTEISKRLTLPLTLVFGIALAFYLQIHLDINPGFFGLHPRDSHQLWGILTAPLMHGDLNHLVSNLSALFGLSAILSFGYPNIANKVVAAAWILTGLCMFLFARSSFFHIGASGVVYALVFYLFSNALLLRGRTPLIIAVIVAFYYGGTIWGLLPLDNKVSWDGHISGAAAGIIVAFAFRRKAQENFEYSDPKWDENADDEDTDEYERFGNP